MTEITKHEPTTIYIKPSKGLAALNLRDLWIYRELVFFMVWRDIKVRYKQTLLGHGLGCHPACDDHARLYLSV